ncbi:hypothetical protein [Corynebacterium sp. A21]|uniref:hypothetical protein n=1 Tax=Corynebacterium sp. A21 TaxID=3457318 RepID=UPI003FD65E7C
MLNNPILITHPILNHADLFEALADSTYNGQRPAPKNLDGMADLLREFRVSKIICADWRLSGDEARGVLGVFADLQINLQR